jgi:uncharacterized protein YjbJ (UPF0337 family)
LAAGRKDITSFCKDQSGCPLGAQGTKEGQVVNRISNKVQEVNGRVKEPGGKAPGGKGLKAGGKADQLKAQTNNSAPTSKPRSEKLRTP